MSLMGHRTCANLPQWAFLHRRRALPETFVHSVMFIDTFKIFSLTFTMHIKLVGKRGVMRLNKIFYVVLSGLTRAS